jgi:hypothetical protein
MLQAIHEIGAALDEDFVMHQSKEAQIDLLNIPLQHLKSTLMFAAMRARTRAAHWTRTENQNAEEIDLRATMTIY